MGGGGEGWWTGRSGGRGKCSGDAMCERRINGKKKMNLQTEFLAHEQMKTNQQSVLACS